MLIVLPGTSNIPFLPKVGVVARWISSGGGGDIGRGGGPIFGGPGLPATGAAILELLGAADVGGGGNRGGGGSIIIGGLVRSTLFGELGTESVPALETLDLASPAVTVAAFEMTEALVLTLDLWFWLMPCAVLRAATALGRAMELTPGVVAAPGGMNWNCCACGPTVNKGVLAGMGGTQSSVCVDSSLSSAFGFSG